MSQTQSENPQIPEVSWIDASQNPWKVPLLDVRPITLGMVSTTADPIMAMNAGSFGRDDGTGFIGEKPSISRTISTNLRFRTDGILADGILFVPRVMEHKWAIYYHQRQIIFIRSWLRKVQAIAVVQQHQDYIEITAIQGMFVSEDEAPAFTVHVLDYLLRSHALDLVYPAPLPDDLVNDPRAAAIWCMSSFGNQAWLATHYELTGSPPEEPLRTDSLFHLAIASGDMEKVKTFLDKGTPVDLLSRSGGMSPLHWALANKQFAMAEFLMSRGCPVDVCSTEGATPLMSIVQEGDMERTLFLLNHGANPNARDLRGFTAMHRAAEMGYIDLVRALLDRGAAIDVEVEGHTPRSLAEMRQETAIVELLDSYSG